MNTPPQMYVCNLVAIPDNISPYHHHVWWVSFYASAEAGIMIAPSHVFDYGHQHFRIGFGRENFGEVLALFGGYVDVYDTNL